MENSVSTQSKPRSKEYDSMYPPLRGGPPAPTIAKSPPQPLSQTTVSKASENDTVIVSSSDRRFKECNSREIQTILKSVCHTYSVKVEPSYNAFGSLSIVVTGASKENVEKAKFSLKEQLSIQSSYSINVNPKYISRITGKDRRNLSRFTKDYFVEFNINYEHGKITITGGSKSVVKVANEILDYIAMNIEFSSKELTIPHIYHRFLQGADSNVTKEIISASGNLVKIAYPQPHDHSNKIIISGKKECVENAATKLSQYYEHMGSSFNTIDVVISKLHKDIITSNFNVDEIFNKEHVSILFTPKDDDQELLTLTGSATKSSIQTIHKNIFDLLKKNSIFSAKIPFWLCLFIERTPKCISHLTDEFKTLSYKCDTDNGYIHLIGEDTFMPRAQTIFTNLINAFTSKLTFSALPISNEHVYALTGKDNSKLIAVEKDTQASIFIVKRLKPQQLKDIAIKDDQSLIIIIGVPKNIGKAREYIENFIKTRSEFVTVELSAPNHLHKHIIGANGKILKELISSNGPECTVSFGKTLEKIDTCTIKGSASEVKALSEAIEAKLKVLNDLHFVEEIDVPKNSISIFSDNNGAFKKELERTGIENIHIPKETDGNSYKITLIGPKKNVLVAKNLVSTTVQEVLKYKTLRMTIQEEFLSKLNEAGSDFMKIIVEDSKGRVDVVLPAINSKEKVITITGPPSCIEYVHTALKNVAKGDHGPYYFELLDIPITFMKDIIGSKGSNIFKIIGTSNVRVISRHLSAQKDMESVLLVGQLDKVQYVKKLIEEEVKTKKDTIELKMEIPLKYKKEFLQRKEGQDVLLQKIAKENGNVRIFIGDSPQESNIAPITITGPKLHALSASTKLKEIVANLDSRIEKTLMFKRTDLRNALRRNKFLLRDLTEDFDVRITIPKDLFESITTNPEASKDIPAEDIEIKIIGSEESINKTIEQFNLFSSSHGIFYLEQPYQKELFAPDSRHYKNITYRYRVELEFNQKANSMEIFVRGLKKDVEIAIEDMGKILDDYYQHPIEIKSKHFTRLIGKKGETVKNFNKDNSVIVNYPRSDSPHPDIVLIVGRKDACLAAAEKLLALASAWDREISTELDFDMRVKQILFGINAANIKKMSNEFNVAIKFVSEEFFAANSTYRKLQISGLPENVEKAKAYIEEMQSVHLETIEEETFYQLPKESRYELDISNIATLKYVDQNTFPKKPKNKPSKPSTTEGSNIESKNAETGVAVTDISNGTHITTVTTYDQHTETNGHLKESPKLSELNENGIHVDELPKEENIEKSIPVVVNDKIEPESVVPQVPVEEKILNIEESIPNVISDEIEPESVVPQVPVEEKILNIEDIPIIGASNDDALYQKVEKLDLTLDSNNTDILQPNSTNQ